MNLTRLEIEPIKVTYRASSKDWAKMLKYFELVLVDSGLPFPLYQTRREWELYGDELYLGEDVPL